MQPPAWLNGINAKVVAPWIWEIRITGYGSADVGPHCEAVRYAATVHHVSMPHCCRLLVRLAVLVSLGACAAKAGSRTPAADAPRATAPRMLTRAPLELREAANLRIEVLVAANGRPDLRTLRLAGGGATVRTAVEQWLAASTFEPARQGDVPVDAVYRTQIRTRVTVRRM